MLAECKNCHHKSAELAFKSVVLNKYTAEYYICHECDFLFINNVSWLEEAYSESINFTDTGIMQRNISISNKLAVILIILNYNKENVLDYAGGYGILVRLMRDRGFNFYWYDKFSENLVSRGFEADSENLKDFRVLTAFEFLEHIENPLDLLKSIAESTDLIILSTELKQEPVPNINDWWYYATEHGQHIAFFSRKTLKYISEQLNMHLYFISGLIIFSRNKISLLKMTAIKLLIKFPVKKWQKLFNRSLMLKDMQYLKQNLEK